MTATMHLEPPILAPGEEIAPGYEVVAHASRGEALDVYEVVSRERLCSCVAKTVRPDRADVLRVRDRLLLEGKLLERMAHPHLLRAFETIADPVPVVILETIAGLTLEEIIDFRARRLPASDVAYLGQHLCSALHYLHSTGYLHLDVRPSNVVCRAGVAVLIDLSLARPPGAVRRGLGTREYFSPEQARGGEVTAATDVWGLGATLFEAATAVAPFAPHTEDEEVAWNSRRYLQLDRGAPDPALFGRRLPSALASVIRDCLSAEAAERPSVLEVHERLGEILEPHASD